MFVEPPRRLIFRAKHCLYERSATSLSALDHFANRESLSRDAAFSEGVRELRRNPATRELGRAAAHYEDKEKE